MSASDFFTPPILRRTAAVAGANRELMLVANDDETQGFHEGETPYEKAKRVHRELMLCKCVMEELQRAYPGHPWQVKYGGGGTNPATGKELPAGVEIKLPVLMGSKSYVIPVPMLLRSLNESQALVRKAGGEILERLKLPRTAFSASSFEEAKALRPVVSHKDPMPE